MTKTIEVIRPETVGLNRERLIDPSLKTLFDDEIAGVVRERLVIPDILADLPRIRELVELTQKRSGLRPH